MLPGQLAPLDLCALTSTSDRKDAASVDDHVDIAIIRRDRETRCRVEESDQARRCLVGSVDEDHQGLGLIARYRGECRIVGIEHASSERFGSQIGRRRNPSRSRDISEKLITIGGKVGRVIVEVDQKSFDVSC